MILFRTAGVLEGMQNWYFPNKVVHIVAYLNLVACKLWLSVYNKLSTVRAQKFRILQN
jgi:hypothetical protein